MDIEPLEQALQRSPDNDAWVDTLARYFSGHDLYYGHGTDNASDEAYWLLRHLQQWRDDPWEAPPDPSLARRAAELAVRRARERIPLAYLINEAWFAGLKFFVDPRVLVPRSPCAELIERAFEPWCRLRPGDRVLDIGTGSGCIAIAAAHYCDGVQVDATDVSGEALAVARENVARHGLEDRVHLHEADLFPRDAGEYRVIISNPPYVPAAEMESLPAEFGHEPRVGLVGGTSGLDPTLRLLDSAHTHLARPGLLVVEVGNEAGALASQVPELPFVWLEFERGGEGVFVLSAEQLERYGRDRGLPPSTAPETV